MSSEPHRAAAPAPAPGPEPSRGGLLAAIKGPGFILSSRRLWLLSTRLHHSGHKSLARFVRNVNSMLYHNYLAMQAQIRPDVGLGHQGFGTVVHGNTVVGRDVKIFQNVTIFVRPPTGTNKVIIEDGVVIGANSVILTPVGEDLRIGRGAAIGAGAVVSHDVPDSYIAVSPRVEMRPRRTGRGPRGLEDEDAHDHDD